MRRLFLALALSGSIAAAQPAPEFEVGTVKVSRPQSVGTFGMVTILPGARNGVFEARNVTMKMLLAFAYDVMQVQISGPDWLDKNHYDIKAKVPDDAASRSEVREMVRQFLAERFSITTHSATHEIDALALRGTKEGLKLRQWEPGEPFQPPIPKNASIYVFTGTMSDLAENLGMRVLKYPVIDQTGVSGTYASLLSYSADNRVDQEPSAYPALPTALKEQMGLELVRGKYQVDVIVVDQANEVPTEN
jgi:uncharacterized protein (TIGR03435 family)